MTTSLINTSIEYIDVESIKQACPASGRAKKFWDRIPLMGSWALRCLRSPEILSWTYDGWIAIPIHIWILRDWTTH